MMEQSKLAVQLDTVHAEFQHRLRCGELSHQPGSMRRFSAGDLTFFQKDDVLAAQFGKMIRNIHPIDPPSDHHDLCLFLHLDEKAFRVKVMCSGEDQAGWFETGLGSA